MTSRIDSLRRNISADSSFLVTNPLNIRYLSGFTGSFGYLLVNPDDAILLTDSRYHIQGRAETQDVTIAIGRDVIDFVRDNCATSTLYIEGSHVTVDFFTRLKSGLSFDVETSHALVEKLRVVKDDTEIAAISKACGFAVQALGQLIETSIRGASEKTIARRLDNLMLDAGADTIAFDTIVASGPHSAIPHHQPTDRIIEAGDFLKIDFGADCAGYKSDMTRTFVVGEPNDFHLSMYSAVRHAQYVGRELLHADVVSNTVDKAVRDVLCPHEHGKTFQHGLGHGVGLAIHEEPFFAAQNITRLASGTVVTIEPGLYVESRGGVRIEDTVVITDEGYRNLTDFTYDLICL